MNIRRVRLPSSVTNAGVDLAPGYGAAATGEEDAWEVAIPWVFRALAAPDADNVMLEPPRPGDDVWTAIAYWSPLVQLLVYSLGWPRPDLGLQRWYAAGQPLEDPRLRLLTDVWRADGQLDWFVAWLLTAGPSFDFGFGAVDGEIIIADPGELIVERVWIDEQRRAAEAWGGHSPLVGGSDPLHLSAHWQGPIAEPESSPLILRSASSQRRAVLLLDSMLGWYRVLDEQGQALPPIGKRSWHVDVVVKPVGWLGTYRRSRLTGRWFSGQHRFHTLGVRT